MLRRALKIDEVVSGEQHPNVAICLNNLATLLIDTNRAEEAEPMLRRALKIDEAAFGEQHPNVAIRLNNLAALQSNTNRAEEAEPILRRALDILNSFHRRTKHVHPSLELVTANYQALQRAKADGPD